MIPITHRPSGSMCSACISLYVKNCDGLPFSTMPVMKTDRDGVKVVKCSEFQRLKGGAA